MQAKAQQDTADANNKMIEEQAIAKQDMRARELIVEGRASQKEAHNAWMEGQRGKAFAAAKGEGMMGSTAGARYAEQGRQASMSIQNAKDRKDSASFNYTAGTRYDAQEAENRMAIESQKASPASLAATVIGSGMSNYGAFG